MKTISKLWLIIVVLIILCPLGLILPAYLGSGAAWGEWGPDELRKMIGYIPAGLRRLSSLWDAPIADYALKAWGKRGWPHPGLGYLISAAIGIGITAGVTILIGKFLSKKD